MADKETFYPPTRADWRAWLSENHQKATGVWLVYCKKNSGMPSVTYDEAVAEALCFGWIDSVPKKIDEQQYCQLFSPRKPRSGWSRVNKQRIDQLLADGLIADAGLAKIEAAKADGSWAKLDEVEDLIVPPDLQAAFDENPVAATNFDGFSRSVKRGLLEYLTNAKRPDTRVRRIADIVSKAADGKRAQFDKP
jgi:uncharacterized protein YdeI (YjbR/CyaY-like superfamily)